MPNRWPGILHREIREFPITVALSVVYVGLFVVMGVYQGGLNTQPQGVLGWMSLDIETLTNFGAIKGDLILEEGQYWRLVTATLLHGSVLHLVLNVLALYQLGRIIEDWYSGSALVWLHLMLGLAGSLASLWTHRFWGARLVQVGGSGAIFGFCAFLAAAVFFADKDDEEGLLRALLWSLAIGFGLGHLLGADNAAHAGGAIAGAAFGCFDFLFRRDVMGRWLSAALGLASWAVFLLAFVLCGRTYFVTLDQEEQAKVERRHRDIVRFQALLQLGALQNLERIARDADRRLQGEPPDPHFHRPDAIDQLRAQARQIENPALVERLTGVLELLDVPEDQYIQPDHLQKILDAIQAKPATIEEPLP